MRAKNGQLNKFCTPHARERFAERYPEAPEPTLNDWQTAYEAIVSGSAILLRKHLAGALEEASQWRVKIGVQEVIAVYRWGKITTVTPNPDDNIHRVIRVADETAFAHAYAKALRRGWK